VREEDEGSEHCTKHKQAPQQQQQRTREEPDENKEIAALRHFMLSLLSDLAPPHPR
jgi:hypothetical protein